MAKQVSAICFMFVVVGLLSDPVHGDVQPEERINGYKFGGNGYVILDKDRFNPSKASLVKFSFRTFASEGLMFLMGTPRRDFLSLELNDGKVIYQYELGSGKATIASTQRYNDGNWHNVTANRLNQDGILKIDASTDIRSRSPGNIKDLDIETSIYFGGFKGIHTYSNASVTQKGFEGCIKDIQLGSTNKNISLHIEAKDILPGCPEVQNLTDVPTTPFPLIIPTFPTRGPVAPTGGSSDGSKIGNGVGIGVGGTLVLVGILFAVGLLCRKREFIKRTKTSDGIRKTNKEDSDRNNRDISDIPKYQQLYNLSVHNLNAIPIYEQLTPSADVDQRLSDTTPYENIGYKFNANESRSSEYEGLQQRELPASDAYESLQPQQ